MSINPGRQSCFQLINLHRDYKKSSIPNPQNNVMIAIGQSIFDKNQNNGLTQNEIIEYIQLKYPNSFSNSQIKKGILIGLRNGAFIRIVPSLINYCKNNQETRFHFNHQIDTNVKNRALVHWLFVSAVGSQEFSRWFHYRCKPRNCEFDHIANVMKIIV